MRSIQTEQEIFVEFGLNKAGLKLEFSESDALNIEDQIMDAIDACNISKYIDIDEMSITEGGIIDNLNYNGGFVTTEDQFYMIINCVIEFDSSYLGETSGISINVNKFKDMLTDIDIIGPYIDKSTVSISEYDYDEDVEYTEYEPDWDSMPGGHDYY